MSPLEQDIIRFIFALDNLLVALIPWLKALAAGSLILIAALLVRRCIRKKRARQYKRLRPHTWR